MSFWGALLALLWDWWSPLYRPSQLDRLAGRYADWILDRFNAGDGAHGLLTWTVAALMPAILAGLLGSLFGAIGHWLEVLWGAAVLYQCLGFRQLVRSAEAAREALQADNLAHARARLSEMGQKDAETVPADDLNRRALESVLELGLHRVFGVLFWFIPLGPFGAVVYALTIPLAWRQRGESDFHYMLGWIASLLEWIPARLLALSFALVGNFEGAASIWREPDAGNLAANIKILMAAGFGALGFDGATPEPKHLDRAAALLKRAVLLWLGLLALLWLG